MRETICLLHSKWQMHTMGPPSQRHHSLMTNGASDSTDIDKPCADVTRGKTMGKALAGEKLLSCSRQRALIQAA